MADPGLRRVPTPLALALSLLVAVTALAVLGGAASARPTDGLRNGGFESGRTGWTGAPSHRVRLAVTSHGHSGRGLLVTRRSARPVRVTSARPVAVTGRSGDRYRAGGWVRGNRNGERVAVVVREYRGARSWPPPDEPRRSGPAPGPASTPNSAAAAPVRRSA